MWLAAPAGTPILAGVPEIRYDRDDALGARAPAGVCQEQQLHEVGLEGRCRGLEQVHIVGADTVPHRHVQLSVGEAMQADRAQPDTHPVGGSLSEGLIGGAREQCEKHRETPGFRAGRPKSASHRYKGS
jgi:hypothetical protein